MKLDKSMELLERAKKVIPMCSQTASKSYTQWVLGSAPVYCSKAEGCYLFDVDGNKYIDHMGALGPIILGYNHKSTNEAIRKQLDKGIQFSLPHESELELAELITRVVPCAEMVRFGKNGSDVTSIAVRIARSFTGRDHLLSPEGHYHGWADQFAAAGPRDYGLPKYLKTLVERFPYNDLSALEDKLKSNKFAALIMEPVSLEAPAPGFLQGCKDLCARYGTVLVFDELVTGFRWSLGGAQKYYGVTPDLATFGKAVANGGAISVLAGRRDLMMELESKVFFSGTYLGETLSIAAAIATINELSNNEEKIYAHIWTQGNKLRKSFNKLCRDKDIDAEMFGLAPRHNIRFGGKDPAGAKDLFHQEMLSRGVFWGNQIYVNWAHKPRHIEIVLEACANSLDVVKKAVDENNIDKYLVGPRSAGIFVRPR